jgi:hypothetical protein
MSNYLNDHLTDETLGIGLAERVAAANKGTRLGTFLEMLSWELETDRDVLLKVMIKLGVGRHLTAIRATIAETMKGRRPRRSSPLGTLAALESLDLRIERKLEMWNALRAAVGDRVDGVDFDAQIHRAELQRELLGRRRLDVAAGALG